MWAILGKMAIDVLASPAGMSRSDPYTYADHAVIEGPPRLQWTGDGPTELQLDIRLHAWLDDPAAQLTAIEAMAGSHRAHALVWGDGRAAGHYVITRLATTVRRQDHLGRLESADLKVTLKRDATPRAADEPPPLPIVARIKG